MLVQTFQMVKIFQTFLNGDQAEFHEMASSNHSFFAKEYSWLFLTWQMLCTSCVFCYLLQIYQFSHTLLSKAWIWRQEKQDAAIHYTLDSCFSFLFSGQSNCNAIEKFEQAFVAVSKLASCNLSNSSTNNRWIQWKHLCHQKKLFSCRSVKTVLNQPFIRFIMIEMM